MFGAVVVLAGCTAPTVERAPVTDPIPYVLDARGIDVIGAPGRIDFGRTDHSTIPAMNKLVGRSAVEQRMCSSGVQRVTWPDGVSLHFAGGNFVGWSRGETGGTIQQAGLTCVSS